MDAQSLYIGQSGDTPQHLLLKYANRHGLIAGATGTGKTLTLQGLAEGFSQNGVPVFIADVKGDLSGLAKPGSPKPPLVERAKMIGYDIVYQGCPVIFWDLMGASGHPVRITISEMGPLLLSRLLQLNDTQEGVLSVAFAVADAEQLLLLDLDDLRALLHYVNDNAKSLSAQYGNVATASISAIQRALLTLEQQGGKHLFGEPALNIRDLTRTTLDGKGIVNILEAASLMQSPKLYAAFMLWLLSELFEDLPEVGDREKPVLVFFFDEAHLLFNDAPKALLEKVEQLVRLIRSKGVGIYFITQNPADIPQAVLGQLSNRVQHALRAFTPQDQKGVRAAADTFRANPSFKTAEAITTLAIGEALVSTLDETGAPSIVERTFIRPPSSQIGPLSDAERAEIIRVSPLAGIYERQVNRESAYEMLHARATATQREEPARATANGPWGRAQTGANAGSPFGKVAGSVATSIIRSVGTQIGREIARGLFRSLLK